MSKTTSNKTNHSKRDVSQSTTKNNTKDITSFKFYYGNRTIKSLENYKIGEEIMPLSVIKAMGLLKKAAIIANEELKLIPKDKAIKIIKATDEVINGNLNDHFPLSVWQIGSGMHSNMNANEVIANKAIEIAGGRTLDKTIIHPVDDINKSQSLNDAFSTAMHIAAAMELKNELLPVIKKLRNSIENKANEFSKVLKIGRTHSMDSFLLTFGDEFTAYVSQLDKDMKRIEMVLEGLYELALGGEIIGTDRITIHKDFATKVVKQLFKLTKIPFKVANNKFAALASKDALVFAHGALKTLATTLIKIANDLRELASGPRCGIGEIILPDGDIIDPIMPGKNNPIQCEVMAMVCAQVFGNDTTITFAGANGHLELNVYKPVIIYNFMQSVRLLTDACNMFDKLCIKGIKINKIATEAHINNTMVTVKELIPQLGDDKALHIVKLAAKENISIKDAAIQLGVLTDDQYERLIFPAKFIKIKK